MKQVLFFLFMCSWVSFAYTQDSTVTRIRTILDKNDLVLTDQLASGTFKDLFEVADSVLLEDYLDSIWSKQSLKDTGSIPLYNYLLFSRWQTMTTEDLKSIHEALNETETLKDELKKLYKEVEKMTVSEPPKKSKPPKGDATLKESPCPRDEAKTLTHSGLRYLIAKKCSFDTPETLTQLQKDILLSEIMEAFKDYQRTSDIDLATHHHLLDRKTQMDSWLKDVKKNIDTLSDDDLRFHPEWAIR